MTYEIDPDYNCLNRIEEWDDETQAVIKKRLKEEIGEKNKFHFLSNKEGDILTQIIEVLIPQKKNKQSIKIAESIDRTLTNKKMGVKYGRNPWKGDFYKKGLTELAKLPRTKLSLSISEILKKNHQDFLTKFIRQVLSDAIEIYFSHPQAWNKIGFPGPAYPEGYAYLDCGEADEWEPKYSDK